MPSIRTNGVALEPTPTVPAPRMLMLMSEPSSPPDAPTDMLKPGICPCKACVTFCTGRDSNTSESTMDTAPVTFTFFCVP